MPAASEPPPPDELLVGLPRNLLDNACQKRIARVAVTALLPGKKSSGFVFTHATRSGSVTLWILAQAGTPAANRSRASSQARTIRVSSTIPDFLNGSVITIKRDAGCTPRIARLLFAAGSTPLRKYQRVTAARPGGMGENEAARFLPGSKSSYSNTGYAFLACIIEQVSGKPYEQFLAEEV